MWQQHVCIDAIRRLYISMGFTQLCGPAGNMLQNSCGVQYKPTVMIWSPIGFWFGQIPMADLYLDNYTDCLDVYALDTYTSLRMCTYMCIF